MKEETNETATITRTPTEAEMNDMHRNAWLNFHADAQEAKQGLNYRYAKMAERFGSYNKMPKAVKEILKEDYAAHEAKWGENGDEMQKRFGFTAGVPMAETEKPTQSERQKDQTQQKQKILQEIHNAKKQNKDKSLRREL